MPNLVLTRTKDQKIAVGDDITITVVKIINNNKVKIMISAPSNIIVDRMEIRKRKEEQSGNVPQKGNS